MKRACLAIVVFAGSARAQPDEPAGDGSGSAATIEPTFEPADVVATPVVATPERPADQPLVLDELRIGSSDRIELFMFGDASAIARSGENPGFEVGELGLQVTAHLAPGFVGRMETVFAYTDTFGTDIDMERMYLEYRSAGWTITGGRTHAELGYWNNAFHHGRWLQLTIDRPHVLRFEDHGGMLPIHHVGVSVAHGPPRGEPGLEVAFELGNGHGPTLLGIQNLGDDNAAKSGLVRVGAVGLLNDTLRFGANLGVDEIAAAPATVYPLLPDRPMLELITGLYLALRGDSLVIYSEMYDVLHRGAGRSWNTADGFVVAGYRLGKLIPYVQVEARRGDGRTDPFYNPEPMTHPEAMPPTDYTELTLGLHHDLSSWSALKLELEGHEPDIGSTEYRIELNWSFGR
jgi:hypothetical protein